MGDPGEGSVFLASELENFAANEVQRCYRGYRVRQRRLKRRRLEEEAAVVIQSCFKGFRERLMFREEINARRQQQQENQSTMMAKQPWLGYMARKQLEKLRREQEQELVAIKQAEAATNIQAHQRGGAARGRAAVQPSGPAAELRRKCQHSQALALTYVSRIGWEHQPPTYETQRFLAAKWRAKRHIVAMDQFQVADMLAEVTDLPQYKQVFINAYIHGKRLLMLCAEAFTQLGIVQHDHQKVHYSAVTEIQRYCNDVEYVPADFMYPDKFEDHMRKQDAETRYQVEFGSTTSVNPLVVDL